MYIFDELTYINNTSLALGFFDGLHLGHKVVLNNAIHIAKKNKTTSTVITFKNHPQTLLSNHKTEYILNNDEKLKILKNIGIDNVILLNFEDISSISGKDYIEKVLVKYFSPIAISTGFNHTFGYNKSGNSKLLMELSELYGYKYYEIPPFVVNGEIVSCSTIKNKLHVADFFNANKLLGYDYFIEGRVNQGEKIAGSIGYPSANITYPPDKISVPFGVYFVQIEYMNKKYNGILNHGYIQRDNSKIFKTEVHILDFNKNIYGENIKISFIAKIRNQINYNDAEKLKEQIKRDIAFVDIYRHFLKEERKK